MSSSIRQRRATIVWFLTLIGSVTVIPALIAAGLSLMWRTDSLDTRYESHFVGQIRTVGIALIGSVLALLSPDLEPQILLGAIVAIFVAIVSVSGIRRAREARIFPPLLRALGVIGGRGHEGYGYDPTQP